MPSIIECRHASKFYDGNCAVSDVSLEVEQGAILALLGASGCGKTTTLRLLAGLETPDAGEIVLNGRLVAGGGLWVPPEARRVGMVFQDYALFPHLTARANVEFALNTLPAVQRHTRAEEMLRLVGLGRMTDRYPHQLSGGEQQRVALARALAPRPDVVLLDEPFSNLDAALRKSMREEVRRILRETGTTAVFVTHDQEEALSIADQVAVMKRGQVLQTGTPQHVYLRPVNREVATFLGEVNFLAGTADGDHVTCALGRLSLVRPAHGRVEIMLRPESLHLQADPDGSARVVDVQFYGHDQMVQVQLPGGDCVYTRTWARTDLLPGTRVRVAAQGDAVALEG